MLNKRGYLVVSCPLPQEYKVGDLVNQKEVFVTDIPTDNPVHIICETDYIDMNAQWPDEPNLFSPQEAQYHRFYRVSLD